MASMMSLSLTLDITGRKSFRLNQAKYLMAALLSIRSTTFACCGAPSKANDIAASSALVLESGPSTDDDTVFIQSTLKLK